jgi:hypothetical protein
MIERADGSSKPPQNKSSNKSFPFVESAKNVAANILGNPNPNQKHSWVPDPLYNKMPSEARAVVNGMGAFGRAVGGDALAHVVYSIGSGDTPAEWSHSPKQAALDVGTVATLGRLGSISKAAYPTIESAKAARSIFKKYKTVKRGVNVSNATLGGGENAISPFYISPQFLPR